MISIAVKAAALAFLFCLLPVGVACAEQTLIVAADGSGQFTSVQAAVDAVPDGGEKQVVLQIKPGVYKGHIEVPVSKPRITFRGDDAATTILTLDWAASKKKPDGTLYGTSGSASVHVAAADFTAENITFENAAGKGKEVGQAVAIKVEGDRAVFRRCRFLGWQDTLYAGAGRQYYRDCYIEGDVDFIFGRAAAVFENCRLHSKGSGYITAQARTEAEQTGGYVFRQCALTAATEVAPASVYLGRPWRPYARVVFLSCTLGAHIRPEGWHNWSKPENEKTAWYGEHKSKGPGANPEARVAWARNLTDKEAEAFETSRFLGGEDRWNPEKAP